MYKLTKRDQNKIQELRMLFPRQIIVAMRRSENGGFCAEIVTFPGCFTEATTLSELVGMVNDAVRTYFEIPKKYVSYMTEYRMPIEAAQHFDVFPLSKKKEESVKFRIISYCEKVNC